MAKDLPTTQNAVVTDAIALDLDTATDGMRHIAMDNRYMCPHLGVLGRERLVGNVPVSSQVSCNVSSGSSVLKALIVAIQD